MPQNYRERVVASFNCQECYANRQFMATSVRSTLLAGAMPILAALNVYTFAAVVRITRGGWPEPSSLPQPLFAWGGVAMWPIVALVFLTPAALVLAALAAALNYAKTRNASLAFFLSGALAIVIIFMDPRGIFIWFFD
jgi:hypothetical protein